MDLVLDKPRAVVYFFLRSNYYLINLHTMSSDHKAKKDDDQLNVARDAINVTGEVIGDVAEGVKEAGSGAMDVVKDGAGLIADVAGDLGDGVREGVVGAKEQMGKIVEGTADAVTEVLDPQSKHKKK